MERYSRICKCGAKFLTDKSTKIHCSPRCRARYWARNNCDNNKYVSEPTFCQVCGDFKSRASWGTCGNSECKRELRQKKTTRNNLNRRLKVMKLLGGAICVYCGCDEYKALEINHKNGGGSVEARSGLRRSLINDLLLGRRNKDDFEITCRVCNAWYYMCHKLGIDKWKIKWN